MTELRSDFLRVLDERGFIHQSTDLTGLDALAGKGALTGYIGFDCTAPSLHVGSLVQIMMLRWLQRTSHRPIVLLGSGTTKVGDPSGRDEQRQLLSDEAIAANKAGIQRIFDRFLEFGEGAGDALMIDNSEWLDGLAYIPFLREYGRHFSVNRMLGFDSVKLRLAREHPLSFLEFNYMVLQAYDFLELARRYDCVLQMGGSDQWGNIVNGVDLARRVENRTLYGLTTPLITTSSGAKMGKTAEGAVWLSDERTSAYDYYQYWRNVEDGDVSRFLKLFTELPLDEIARLEALEGAELNEAKEKLAFEATKLCHGEEAAKTARKTAESVFGQGGVGVVKLEVEAAAKSVWEGGLSVTKIPRAELEKGIAAFELFKRSGLRSTGGEARKLIRDGGARINGEPVASETQAVTTKDVNEEGVIKLSAGRKRHALVRPV